MTDEPDVLEASAVSYTAGAAMLDMPGHGLMPVVHVKGLPVDVLFLPHEARAFALQLLAQASAAEAFVASHRNDPNGQALVRRPAEGNA